MRRLWLVAGMLAMVSVGCGKDHKPTAPTPAPTGSCCAVQGTCTVTKQAECTGAWTTGGVCAPNPCPQPPPTGACCTAAGTCTVTTEATCSGTWTLLGVCTPNPCVQPTGSCCAVQGTCTVTKQADCTGAWTTGGVCAPNPCPQPPPTGSCCALDGTCTVTTQTACPGAWTEAGICEPNPCPQPSGSCCAVDGTCTVTLQAACSVTWAYAGICEPNPCPQPPEMVWVPAGNVRLGQAGIAEPVNDFYVEGFWIDRYEVSNAAYKAFIDAGGYRNEAFWNPVGWDWRVANSITLPGSWSDPAYHGGGVTGNETFPVSGVSWWEADAYCRWAGGRLPTEAEWEKAAKGGCEKHGDPSQCDAADTPSYPWGEDITGAQANYWSSGDPYETNSTPVGYYDGSNHGGYQTIDSPSPYGLYDVVGNVGEWCSTTSDYRYPYNPKDGRENPPASFDEFERVLRGGSWDAGGFSYVRCAVRWAGFSPDGRNAMVGFRCSRTG